MAPTGKRSTITVVTTERYEIAGEREAFLIVDYVNSTQTMFPSEGTWSVPDLPQVGDSKFEATVDKND